METPSNLYAEKVFAEHPLGLWTFDDDVDYISLISEADRSMSTWTVPDGLLSEAQTVSAISGQPFPSSVNNLLSNGSGEDYMMYYTPTTIPLEIVNQDLATISFSINLYDENQDISSIQLGWVYADYVSENLPLDASQYETFNVTSVKEWVHLSSTFDGFTELLAGVRFFVRVNLNPTANANIFVNGITIGQWSEEFQLVSLGRSTTLVDTGTADLFNGGGIEAPQYGLNSNSAYYMVLNNRLLAKNSGIPLVYGSKNVTTIYPHQDGGPSMMIPALDMLHKNGKYRNYTAEMWLRINAESSAPRRIFGPLTSTDGIYVDGPFITLSVGDSVGTHYISEWYRPMLVHLTYSPNRTTLMINGEEVISLDINADDLFFPSEKFGASSVGEETYFGLYAYSDVPQIDVDCFSIYSYVVPKQVAKRRLVYGQGVEYPETLNSSYNGTSLKIDYPYSGYTANYVYPDLGGWGQGTYDSMSIDGISMSAPSYKLPTFVFDNQTYADWVEDVQDMPMNGVEKISLRPLPSWNSTNGYVRFDKINMFGQNMAAVYGVFEINREDQSEQLLLRFDDEITGNYFYVSAVGTAIGGYTISYKLKYGQGATEQTVFSLSSIVLDDRIYVGINFEMLTEFFGGNVAAFFGARDRLKVYVGGEKSLSTTFSGNIVRVGFCTKRNFSKISDMFSYFGIAGASTDIYDGGDSYFGNDESYWQDIADGGTPTSTLLGDLTEHVASYTLTMRDYFGQHRLDILSDSYWEDYTPLTYFSKTVSDKNGQDIYDVDFIQFNIEYPKPISIVNGEYDTSSSMLRSYVTFQYVSSGANKPQSNFTSTVGAPQNNVIEPGDEWLYTRYEVVDGMVIYPPESVDPNDIAICVSVEMLSPGIIYSPVKLRSLKLSSKALDGIMPNAIGTRFGAQMFPYKKSGFYFDYKSKNPFCIYRGASPYLYLTRNTGIKPVGDFLASENRGLTTPVNAKNLSDFKVAAIQGSIMFDMSSFPTTPTSILELQSDTQHIRFYVVSDHPSNIRGKIYAIDILTGQPSTSVMVYLNGNITSSASVSLREWNMLAIAFKNSFDFSGKAGGLRVNGPVLVNNLSYYEETAIQKAKSGQLRQWFGVLFYGDTVNEWTDWTTNTWQQVLVIDPESYYGVDPADLYGSYAGTNKIIAGDDVHVVLNAYQYTAYNAVSSQSQTIIPV